MDLYCLKRQIYNLTVILNKLNQKHFRNSQCKHSPFPNTRIVTSLIEDCHVTLKTTLSIVKGVKFLLISINENIKSFNTKKIAPGSILCGGSSDYKKPSYNTLKFFCIVTCLKRSSLASQTVAF